MPCADQRGNHLVEGFYDAIMESGPGCLEPKVFLQLKAYAALR